MERNLFVNSYNKKLNKTYKEIEGLIEETRKRIYKTVNTEMVLLYWMVGKTIRRFVYYVNK